MSYKGNEIFYKKPINTELHQAIEISKNYEYYYKEHEKEESPKFLGKFIEFRMYRSSGYYDDTNYPIIVFEHDFIFENNKRNIYAIGIPDSNENKILIHGMDYEGFLVYYQP